MHAMLESKRRRGSAPPPVTTTLYDLMEAMQDEDSTDADDLVVTAVLELLRAKRLAFLRREQSPRPFRPTLDPVSYS
jgi:hypothetical protein